MRIVFRLFVINFIIFYIASNVYSQSDECDISNEWSIVIPDTNANQGECICIPVIGYNFEGLSAFQISFCWDESVLDYKNVNGISLTGEIVSENNVASGELRYLWFDTTGTNPAFVNGQPLFEICFNVIGQDCTTSEIEIDCVENFGLEIVSTNGTLEDFCLDNGTITISDNCSGTCTASNGLLQIKTNP